MLTIYNSLSHKKEIFTPIAAPKVNMYVCGITVYDYCHIGHARMVVVFDMIARWLKASGYALTYIRNITDIDDKIIQRAAENQETIETLTNRFIVAMHEDFDALGAMRPDAEPRATQFIENMQTLITQLIAKGMAYTAENGDVYYAVRQFVPYGKLSGKSLENLRAGERVELDPYKRDPLDFVLWKAAKVNEPSWDSPWGAGRPGWHIECSAMSEAYLGNYFDLHGGGQDLQFPHHENEIAQSEGAHGHDFVKYWLHNGFVRVDDEKMSKSLGNFFTIRDVLQRYSPEVVRFFILRAHYRSQLNYSDTHLDDAKNSLTTLYLTLQNLGIAVGEDVDWQSDYAQRFKVAMDDDFNTVEAIAVLFELAHEVNRNGSVQLATLLHALGGVLGILQQTPSDFLKDVRREAALGEYTAEQIDVLIDERNAARANSDFAKADAVRDTLSAAGVILEDSGHSTLWRRK